MTDYVSHSDVGAERGGGSAGFAVVGSVLLTLIWAAYTLLITIEIASTPMPPH